VEKASSHKFVNKKRKSSDESLDCFNDLWEEYTSNTNSPSWNRNKSAKKMLNLKNGKEVSNFDNQNLFEENKFHDPNSKTKFILSKQLSKPSDFSSFFCLAILN
jgi:hypothetical protein